jgi:hypothetical protein
MISDTKLKLILTLYKNDKLTLEEVKILLQEESKEEKFTGPFQLKDEDLGKLDWTCNIDPSYDLLNCPHCNKRCNSSCNQ